MKPKYGNDVEVFVRFWHDRANKNYREHEVEPGDPGYEAVVTYAKDQLENHLAAHLSPRHATALENAGITKISHLKGKTFMDLVSIHGVGIRALQELQQAGFIQIIVDTEANEEEAEEEPNRVRGGVKTSPTVARLKKELEVKHDSD